MRVFGQFSKQAVELFEEVHLLLKRFINFYIYKP